MAVKPNSIRIQSGLFRGRTLSFPNRPGLRPATGEMRETLFNWIRPQIDGMHVLDAFAGSGALGFEALSQGAHSVKAYEIDELAYHAICDNLKRFPDNFSYELTKGDFMVDCKQLETFDIIFLDPPYDSNLLKEALFYLSDKINNHTLVFIHHSSSLEPNFDRWEILKSKQRKKRCYALLKTKQKD